MQLLEGTLLQENFFSPKSRITKGTVPGLFQGKEKTCPTSKSLRIRTLFYVELESPRSHLGRSAPLSGLSRGKSPLSQPPAHLGHQGLTGHFPVRCLHRLLQLERTDFAEASIPRVRAGTGSRGLWDPRQQPLSLICNSHGPQEVRLAPSLLLLVGVGAATCGERCGPGEGWRNAKLVGASASRVPGGQGQGLCGVIPRPLYPSLWDR